LNTLGDQLEFDIGNKKCRNDFLLNKMGDSSLYHTFVSHSELFNILSVFNLLFFKHKNREIGGGGGN